MLTFILILFACILLFGDEALTGLLALCGFAILAVGFGLLIVSGTAILGGVLAVAGAG